LAKPQEANVPTLVELFEQYLKRPDVVEQMRPAQAACDEWLRLFQRTAVLIGGTIQRVAELPRSPGYEPWLIKQGSNPIAARGMAHLIVRHGSRISKESLRLSPVVKAIRFLAKPSRNRPAISRNVAILLTAWQETSIIETIFDDAGLDEFQFIAALKSVAGGNQAAYRQLMEIAAPLLPYLPTRRGRKVSAESAAHEYFLGYTVPFMRPNGPGAYSWNDPEQRFTDSMTEATRREFDLPHFSPRSASHRLKARKQLNCVDCCTDLRGH
jgi:hypothetical protein